MTPGNVVPNVQPLTEEQFTDTWLVTLNRLCRHHGDARVALWLGVGVRHLRNLKAGTSLPSPEKVWNLLARDSSAHDELDAEYGLRTVPLDALCSTDPVASRMAKLLTRVIEAEARDSPGGAEVVLHEVLAMAATADDEAAMRAVGRAVAGWISMLDEARKPARLRSVTG